MKNDNIQNENESIQISLTDSVNDKVIQKLESIDINTLTPIESMNTLFEIKKLLNK